jgi:hypothetical protein
LKEDLVDRRPIAILVARIAALIGLAVSAILVVEYASPVPTLCGPGGGCTAVRACWEQRVPWLSLPWFGLVAFGLALSAALLVPEDKAKKLLAPIGALSILGGVGVHRVSSGDLQVALQVLPGDGHQRDRARRRSLARSEALPARVDARSAGCSAAARCSRRRSR